VQPVPDHRRPGREPWFSEAAADKIGRITTSRAITEFRPRTCHRVHQRGNSHLGEVQPARVYQFHARLRSTGKREPSGYSPAKKITLS